MKSEKDFEVLIQIEAGQSLVRSARSKLASLMSRIEGDGDVPLEVFLDALVRVTDTLEEAARVLVMQGTLVESSLRAGVNVDEEFERLRLINEDAISNVKAFCDLLDTELGTLPEGTN